MMTVISIETAVKKIQGMKLKINLNIKYKKKIQDKNINEAIKKI